MLSRPRSTISESVAPATTTSLTRVLRNGWGAAEARAKSSEKMFKKSEMDYLRVVFAICRADTKAASEIDDLTLRDVDVRFTRNRSDNMQAKAQTLQIMLACGINYEDAIEYAELFSDPTAVTAKSLDRLDRIWGSKQEEQVTVESVKYGSANEEFKHANGDEQQA